MFNGIFWGIVLVVFGLLFLIRSFVNIPIPVFRIFFGILLVYWGINILFGGFFQKNEKAIFREIKVKDKKIAKEYNAIFGTINIDLSEMDDSQNTKAEINVVFGKAYVLLPDSVYIIINCSSAFGNIKTPGNTYSFFSDNRIELNKEKANNQPLIIEANAVFGEIIVDIAKK